METKRKSNVLGAIGIALVISIVCSILGLWYWHNDKRVTQENAIQECQIRGYGQMDEMGLLKNGQDKNYVVNNCNTLEDRIHGILDGYNAKWFPVFITGNLVTDCGELSTGCVTSYHNGIGSLFHDSIPPVMTISYTADYDLGLEHTVTHEYIHTLTNKAEGEWLMSNSNGLWGGIDPLEGVADCGISYFMPNTQTGGSYMSSCSPEQTEIAKKVITDTLVP